MIALSESSHYRHLRLSVLLVLLGFTIRALTASSHSLNLFDGYLLLSYPRFPFSSLRSLRVQAIKQGKSSLFYRGYLLPACWFWPCHPFFPLVTKFFWRFSLFDTLQLSRYKAEVNHNTTPQLLQTQRHYALFSLQLRAALEFSPTNSTQHDAYCSQPLLYWKQVFVILRLVLKPKPPPDCHALKALCLKKKKRWLQHLWLLDTLKLAPFLPFTAFQSHAANSHRHPMNRRSLNRQPMPCNQALSPKEKEAMATTPLAYNGYQTCSNLHG